ncbi:WEB family protein At5g16730, chloroplastic [Linum perenne]
MASKTKTGLFETPLKPSPSSLRTSKLSRGAAGKSDADSPSSLNTSRLSLDRSPGSVNSKPATPNSALRRPTKVTTTPPEKPQARGVTVKGSELQAQLNALQEDLKKAKEQISVIEKEKEQAVIELKNAQKAADEANGKLQEALVAQKRAEENSEIDKFRAVELEQAGIEAVTVKEHEWQKEIDAVRNQHALDVATLLSTTQEVQRMKQELAMTTDAKNQALSHADDATKIAEIHAEKVEILSAELIRLRGSLDAKVQTEASESNKLVLKLKEEIDALRQDLEKAKAFEEKLTEREVCIEQLNVEVEAAKMAESYARNLAEEWKDRVEELESKVVEANNLERSASESLSSVMKQLEGNKDMLHDAEAEIAALKEKLVLLEMTIATQRGDLEESESRVSQAQKEALEVVKEAESLKSELETVKEEKMQALRNEKLSASSVEGLIQEKNKLISQVEDYKEEEEKSKRAMESLASALHEVSAEAREAKEKLFSSGTDCENYKTQIEDLRLVLKASNERYESMIDDAKHEIDVLKNSIEESDNEFQKSKSEWEIKEQNLLDCVKKSQEENAALEKEIDRLVNVIKHTEEEACAAREEEALLKNSLKEVEAEAVSLQEALGEAKAESMKLKESLLDKENELQSILQENEELCSKEVVSLKRIEELSKLLEEAQSKKQSEVNGELTHTDSEKDYDLLPKVIEFSEENGHVGEEKPVIEPLAQQQDLEEPRNDEPLEHSSGSSNDAAASEKVATKVENGDDGHENGKHEESKGKEDDTVEVELKMWESSKIEKKDIPQEGEHEHDHDHESLEEECESKAEGGGESLDQVNGLSSTENPPDDGGISPPSKQQPEQQLKKKKKPLLHKFGSLLKKKSTATSPTSNATTTPNSQK